MLKERVRAKKKPKPEGCKIHSQLSSSLWAVDWRPPLTEFEYLADRLVIVDTATSQAYYSPKAIADHLLEELPQESSLTHSYRRFYPIDLLCERLRLDGLESFASAIERRGMASLELVKLQLADSD